MGYKKLAPLTVAILFFSGCSILSPEQKPKSKASMISSSAGFEFRDRSNGHSEVLDKPSIQTIEMLNLGALLRGRYFKKEERPLKNSIFAWMPSKVAETKEQARIEMTRILRDSISKSLAENNWKHKDYSERDRVIFSIINESWGCELKKGSQCYIYIVVDDFYQSSDPLFFKGGEFGFKLDHHQLRSRAYNNSTFNRLAIVNEPKIKHFDSDLLLSISQNLPEWIYLYLAPKEINLADGTPLQFPILLEKGKPLLYVRPNATK